LKVRSLLSGLAVVLATTVSVRAASDTVAVLSSDLAPYTEALAGFQAELAKPVDVIRLTEGPPRLKGQPRVIVAFGGKAVRQKYPDGSILIYCMAPGTQVTINDHRGPTAEISMMPEPKLLLSRLKSIQPSLKRLAMLWSSPAFEAYARQASREGPRMGIEIEAERVGKTEDLPDRLRKLKDRADALWLPPDPLLINPSAVVVMTQFGWSNHVPLFTAVAGLTEQGAVASVSSTYRELGRSAAVAARKALDGETLASEYYPSEIMLMINRQSAAKSGMEIPSSIPGETQRSSP
jgi:putative tryptophan/tyrosine transport system substrate-binding protein